MKRLTATISLLCFVSGAWAQNSALLAGSGASIFLAYLPENKKAMPVQSTFSGNKAKWETRNLVYSGQYFLQRYDIRYQYGLNAQGNPASSSVLKLKAENGNFPGIQGAVRQADSLGAGLKQILSASTEAAMSVFIDGPERYAGLEHFNTRTEEGGWQFMRPGYIGRLYAYGATSVFYPLKEGVDVTTLKACFLEPEQCSANGFSYAAEGDITMIIQSLSPMINIPYGYEYTCYRIRGKKAEAEAIASSISEWQLKGDMRYRNYLLWDLVLIKGQTINQGKTKASAGGLIVLDKINEKQYSLQAKGAGKQEIVSGRVRSLTTAAINTYLENPAGIPLPIGRETGNPGGQRVQSNVDKASMMIKGEQPDFILPPLALFFLNPQLKPY